MPPLNRYNIMIDLGDSVNEKITLKEKVYNQIFEDIIEGKYPPNHILTENGLIEKYKVSKSPVREALIELCKDNVLHSLPRLGYQVVPITLREVLDILEFRLDLEICALRRSFPKLTQSDLEMLRKVADIPEKEMEKSILPHWLRNQQFHLALCKLSRNEYSYNILKDTLKQSSRYVSQYFNHAWESSGESNGFYHLAVTDALERRDIDLACRMLAEDIMAVKKEIQEMHFLA